MRPSEKERKKGLRESCDRIQNVKTLFSLFFHILCDQTQQLCGHIDRSLRRISLNHNRFRYFIHSKLFHSFSALILIKSHIVGFKLITREGRKVQVSIKHNWYKQVKKRGEEEQVEAEQ